MNISNMSQDAENILQNIKSENNIDEKLRIFKIYMKSIKEDDSDEYIRDLLVMYFLLESKHPIKSLIQAFFNQMTNKRELAANLLVDLLENQIRTVDAKNDDLVSGYKFISHLNELSQNFEIAIIAVGRSCSYILKFLNSIIKVLTKQLNDELSPSKKIEIATFIHNCFQLYIFCVRTSIRHDGLNTEPYSWIEELNQICKNMFENNNIGLETKNIFAMLVVIRNNFLGLKEHILLISDDNEEIQKRLCLMCGVIQTTNYESVSQFEKFCIILKAIYEKNSIDNGIVYNISRILMQIIKKLPVSKNNENFSSIDTVTKVAASISFLNLEHNVESVKYMSKDTIKILIEFGHKIMNGDKLVEDILTQISLLPIELKSQAISGIHQALPVNRILEKIPDLLGDLLSLIENHKECKTSCYLVLSRKAYNEFSFDDWYRTFIERLTMKVRSGCESESSKLILFNLLLKCIKNNKHAVHVMLKQRGNLEVKFNFMLLNVAKEEGILDCSIQNETLWRGIIPYKEIKSAMLDVNVDVRLSAIFLIVDTKKATQEFSEEEIKCILFFFEKNVNLQISSTKQTMIGIIKKIFIRLQSNIQNSLRKNNKTQIRKNFEILMKFHRFCFENLEKEPNFSRRNLSLVLLKSIAETIQRNFHQESEHLWTTEHFNALYDILNDSYESNKEKALELISHIPRKILSNFSQVSFIYLEQLHKSIRPADSSTATYLVLFCIKYLYNEEESAIFQLLSWCEKQLLEGIKIAENSIIVAAGSNPLYPFLSTIRSVIEKLNFNDLLVHQYWKEFFERLVHMTKRLTKIASPIVNDSSPEGLVPNENFDLLLNGENEEYFMKILKNTTSQMILLCAWRIIKEVSLLLGDLSLKTASICGTDNELFSVNQLIDIGDQFLELLTNIKHRGAFEQCFTGFSQYCIALKTSHCYELHNLPSKILHNIINSVVTNSTITDCYKLLRMKNLCATRRSAGLPFIVQAILSSEINVSKYENFHYTMKQLLHFSQFATDIEIRIHALNILRILFKCKELNDIINEYICEGIKCSILGCDSEQWAIRNSSTLLFSSLMIRIFGVQRNKDTDHIDIKNMMSSRIFFLRYPELYEFFTEQLNQSVCNVMQEKRNAKLYPLLLILNRLFTSPSEACEPNIKLMKFIPNIVLCSGCIDLKVRILCAKFVSNVNPLKAILPRILQNLSIIQDYKELKTNFKHGRLLEILYLVKKIKKPVNSASIEQLKMILDGTLDLLKHFKSEIICFSTILDIIINIYRALTNYNCLNVITFEKLKKCFEYNHKAYFGIPVMQSQLVIIRLILMQESENVLFFNHNAMSFQELLVKLNCAIYILNDTSNHKIIADVYEIDENLQLVINNFSTDKIDKIRQHFKTEKGFIKSLQQFTEIEDVSIQARSYEALSCTNAVGSEKVENINLHLGKVLNKPDDYKAAVLKFTSSWIQMNMELVDLIDWKILSNITNCSYYVQINIINVLKLVVGNLSRLSFKTLVLYAMILSSLLMDDNFNITEEASKVVSSIVKSIQVYITSYAFEIFVRYLIKECNLKDHEKAMLLLLLSTFARQKFKCNAQHDEVNEFQIFEKTEANNSQEWFVLNDILSSIWKDELTYTTTDEFFQNMLVLCKKIEIEADYETLLKNLEKLN